MAYGSIGPHVKPGGEPFGGPQNTGLGKGGKLKAATKLKHQEIAAIHKAKHHKKPKVHKPTKPRKPRAHHPHKPRKRR
jgi:hypothetical protein